MEIAQGFHMLELEAMGPGGLSTLNPVLFADVESAVLIDTGMPGMYEKLRAAAAAEGISLDQVRTLILSHQDLDHIGSAPEVLQNASGPVTVYAHGLDLPYIEGQHPLIKTTPERMATMLAALPEQVREHAARMFANPPKCKVDETLQDGQLLPIAGGLRVLFTPGHTPGHLSFYHEPSKTLIAADAMLMVKGALHGPVPMTTIDMEEAWRSVERFAQLELDAVICYHGGLCRDNVQEQIRGLLEKNRLAQQQQG